MKTIALLLLVTSQALLAQNQEGKADPSLTTLKNLKEHQRVAYVLKRENLIELHKFASRPNYSGNAYAKYLNDIWKTALTQDIDFILTNPKLKKKDENPRRSGN